MRYRVSYLMDEIWERAVETALDGQTDHGAARTLTLDGAVKCVQGRLPPPSLLERFENLEHLSIANIGVSSLEQFPRLKNLQKLILSDNRIAGGLEFLVQAGLESLRDLDLSNNRIQYIEDLAPLAQLRIVSLDLYECPVTRVKDYRSRVFAMIKSLNYLDKMDAEENERPETDDEEDDDEDDDEDDPGSGEIDGEERPRRDNGHSENIEGIVDMDEEEESDADEEEAETTRGPVGQANGLSGRQTNGYRVEVLSGEEIDDDDDDDEGEGEGEDDDDNDSVEEVYEEDDMVEVYEVGRVSDDEEDGVDDDDDNDNDDDDDDDDEDDDEEDDEDEEEEVDNENRDGDFGEPDSTGRLTSTEGEIDGHEQGEEDVDGDGETGEEEQAVEDDGVFEVEDEEDEDYGAGYLVQPVGETEEHDGGGSDMDPGTEEGDAVEEEVEDDDEVHDLPPSSSHLKRKRVDNANEDPGTEEGDAVAEEVEDDDEVQDLPPSSSHLKRKRVDNANEEEDNGEDDDDDDDDDDVQQAYSKSSSKKHH